MNILSIPLKLRANIFSLLLTVDSGEITVGRDAKAGSPFESLRVAYHIKDLINHPIFFISRQIRKEALSIFLGTNIFYVQCPRSLALFLEHLGPSFRSEISCLTLDIIPWMWRVEKSTLDNVVRLLETCTRLHSLNIEIPPIWALCPEENIESLWTTEDIILMSPFSSLAKLRGIERLKVNWTDFEDDWIDWNGQAVFRDRPCDHSVEEAHAVLREVVQFFESTLTLPRRRQSETGHRTLCKSSAPKHGFFPFLNLPRELRDEIYSIILTYPSYLRLLALDADQWDPQTTFYPFKESCKYAQDLLQHPLLATSKQIRAESLVTLYSNNTFKIPSSRRFDHFLTHLGPAMYDKITSIVFTPDISNPSEENEYHAIAKLAMLRKLKHLVIYLASDLVCDSIDEGSSEKLGELERVYQHPVIAILGDISGLDRVEIRWFLHGTWDVKHRDSYLQKVSQWLQERMQRQRDDR